MTIRAHFDDRVIVPDEAVALPAHTPLTVRVETAPAAPRADTPAQRRAAYDAFLARAQSRPVPRLPDEALRRESIYED